jgi:hypothetical protein
MRISIGIYRYISINTATSDLGSGLPRPAFYCVRISIGIYLYISINTATSDLGSGLPRPAFYCVRISIGIYRYTSVYIDKYRMYAYMVYT